VFEISLHLVDGQPNSGPSSPSFSVGAPQSEA